MVCLYDSARFVRLVGHTRPEPDHGNSTVLAKQVSTSQLSSLSAEYKRALGPSKVKIFNIAVRCAIIQRTLRHGHPSEKETFQLFGKVLSLG